MSVLCLTIHYRAKNALPKKGNKVSNQELDCPNHEDDCTECPAHDGGYDCTPFCIICEGEQGYCPEKIDERARLLVEVLKQQQEGEN